ncbi:MAG: hypothetical protein M3R36_11840 [Bacteroidota bacterium]|nr:hypothetical protein [Bacteroidota bacterium]
MKKFINIALFIFIYLQISNSIQSQPISVDVIWEKVANVGSMEFTPNGQFLITGGYTNVCYPYTCGQIKIWRVQDSALINTIQDYYMGYPNDISVSNDGQSFITGNGSIYCAPNGGCSYDHLGQFKWNFSDGVLLDSILNPGGIVQAIDYSPDNSLIASGTSQSITGEIRIYDNQFNLIRTLPGHEQETSSLKFTPDGQKLVSGGHDGKVRIWNVSDGSLITTLDHGTYTNGGLDVKVDISPDGQLIASGGQGYNMTIKIWRLSDGTLLHTINVVDEIDGYNTPQFSPNGIYIASGITTYGLNGLGWYGLLKFWRVSDAALVREYIDSIGSPTAGGVRTIAFSSSGNNYFAYSISNRLRLASTNLDLVINSSPKNLLLTSLIEGLYDKVSNIMVQDTVTVYLRNTFAPYTIADSAKARLNSAGIGTFQFRNAANNINYFIQVKHMNSIQTWSKNGHSFNGDFLNYDFTSAASQAYGNNLTQEGNEFTIYSGDVNQDGTIDLSDGGVIDNDLFNFVSGYVSSDVNGDSIIDLSDLEIADNNIISFVSIVRP